MEADGGEVVLGHLKDVVGVGKEYVAAFAVERHILIFTLLEGVERGGVV